MALVEGQFQVRNLVMGPGTQFEILRGTNPFARTVRADQSGPRAWNHGSWSGVEWAESATVPLYIRVRGASNDVASWMTAQQTLAAAFAPVGESPNDVELRFVIGGTEYLMRGRPRMVEPDLTLINSGKSITQAAFVALDPFIYSGAETVAGPLNLPTVIGGLTIPLTVPFTIDAVPAGGTAVLVNAGTAETGLMLRIDGPVTDPVVSLTLASGTVQTLRFDATIVAGEWIDVDTAARTVTLNGTTSLRGQTSGVWPILPAGSHTIRWLASDMTQTGTLTVRFRSAWW